MSSLSLHPSITLKDVQDILMQIVQESTASVFQGFTDCMERRVDEKAEGMEDRFIKAEDIVELVQNDMLGDMEPVLRKGLNNTQEKLREEAATDQVVILVCDPEEILREKVYKVYLGAARQRNPPRDVAVCFSRKSCHSEITQALYQQRSQLTTRLKRIEGTFEQRMHINERRKAVKRISIATFVRFRTGERSEIGWTDL